MGISSDGIFFYGLMWKDKDDPPWKSPTPDELENSKYGEPDWEELYEVRSGNKTEHSPVELDIHCSFDCSMHYLAVKRSLVRAYRGGPKQVKVLEASPEWEGQLKKFCETMGIKWREPSWWLTSLYG